MMKIFYNLLGSSEFGVPVQSLKFIFVRSTTRICAFSFQKC